MSLIEQEIKQIDATLSAIRERRAELVKSFEKEKRGNFYPDYTTILDFVKTHRLDDILWSVKGASQTYGDYSIILVEEDHKCVNEFVIRCTDYKDHDSYWKLYLDESEIEEVVPIEEPRIIWKSKG